MGKAVDKILEVARADLGYYAPNDPLTGSKAARWMHECWSEYSNADAAHRDGILNWEGGSSWLANMSSTELWWCCCFASMVIHKALHPRWNKDVHSFAGIPGLPNYQCDNFISKLRNSGKGGWILANKRDCQPGDIVLFDWNSSNNGNHYSGLDHIGIIEANCGSYAQTLEGNTSGSWNGSQSAGNGVYRRTRSWSNIACIVHPPYEDLVVWNTEYKPPRTTPRPTGKENGGVAGPVYRLYNKYNYQHLYTQNKNEYDQLVKYGWEGEGVAFTTDITGDRVYRLYNPYSGQHLLTKDLNEAQSLYDRGWDFEGIAFRSGGSVPVWRLYNSSIQEHLYTTSNIEHAVTQQAGWKQEGVAFWAVS